MATSNIWRGISSFIFDTRSRAAVICLLAMQNQRQGVHHLTVDHDVHAHQLAAAVIQMLVIQRGVPLGDGLETVVEIEHDLVQRQLINNDDAALGSDT